MATQPNTNFDNAELVEVFDTEQETEALVIQGLLESSGIESMITARDNPQDILPMGGVVVRVTADKADEARRIIEAYHQDTETELVEDDGDSSSDETETGG
jgi:Putative prokaryotic signal transducing protein